MALTVIEAEMEAARKAHDRERLRLLAEARDLAERARRLPVDVQGLLLDALPRVPVTPRPPG